MKPDRFARVVEKSFMFAIPEGRYRIEAEAAQLLRREHRAVVRLVRREMELARGQCYAEQRGDALNEILVALARRAK